MLLDLTFRRLNVNVPGAASAFSAARARSAALAAYASPSELLERLKSRRDGEEKLTVIAALVAEQRKAPNQLWHVLLLHAFKLLFNTLALVKDDDEDAGQRVRLGLLNA